LVFAKRQTKLRDMAQKYIPTVRDQKAAVRFLSKQRGNPDYTKSSHTLASKAAATRKTPSPGAAAPSSAAPDAGPAQSGG
jgi:hypothetical protein